MKTKRYPDKAPKMIALAGAIRDVVTNIKTIINK